MNAVTTRRALLVFAVTSLSACTDFKTELSNCRSAGGCGRQPGSFDAQVDGGDSGADAGGGDVDAGAVCPGAPWPLCRADVCYEGPSKPVDLMLDVFVDDRAVWAVGNGGVVACHDGQSWRYDLGPTQSIAYGVHGDGTGVTVVTGDGTIRRWSYELREWTNDRLPSPYDNEELFDVWTAPSYSAYAHNQHVCEAREGVEASCGVGPNFAPRGVHGLSANDVLAVGGDRVLRWTGSGAPVGTTLATSGDLSLNSGCLFPDGGVFVGGERLNPNGTITAAFINGTWSYNVRGGGELPEVACLSTGATLVVVDGVLERCSALSTCVPEVTAATGIYGVAEGGGKLVAAGLGGLVQQTPVSAANDWSLMTQGHQNTLLEATVAPDGTIYAVGDNCTLLHRGADSWTQLPVNGCSGLAINDIYFEPDGDGWLVGQNGNMWLLPSGAAVADLAFEPSVASDQTLNAITGRGAELWAVGTNGIVGHAGDDGQWQFFGMDSGIADYRALAMKPDGGIAAITVDSVVEWEPDGGWTSRVVEAAGPELFEVWVDDSNRIYVFNGYSEVRTAMAGTTSSFTSLQVAPTLFNPPRAEAICGSDRTLVVGDASGRLVTATLTASTVSYVERPSPTSATLYGVACGANRLVGVGEYGAIVSGPR